jgi:hypothetical protein
MKRLIARLQAIRMAGRERGFTTAELLGNAALGVVALMAIWLALQAVGVNIVQWIQGQLMG